MSDCQEYEDWKDRFVQKHGRLPEGRDILKFWEKNPEVKKKMCPHPARIAQEGRK